MARPPVEDELAIRELYARYSWALDTGDTDGYCALFTEDAEATEETSTGELEVRKGRDEIRKLVLKFHERPDFPGHQHQMDQMVFEPDPRGGPTTGGPLLRLGDDQPPAGTAAPPLVRPRPRRDRQGRRRMEDRLQGHHGLGRQGAQPLRQVAYATPFFSFARRRT